jgi:calcium/calmodulin-dependent protein kinase (CaM kinase) II
MSSSPVSQHEVVRLTEQLLAAIVEGNWATYEKLCDPRLTCFEPEALGHLVQGLDFHRFYFADRSPGTAEASAPKKRVQVTVNQPQVWATEQMAVIAYVRLVQVEQEGTRAVEETRVWQRIDGQWKHVHFHRSPPGS